MKNSKVNLNQILCDFRDDVKTINRPRKRLTQSVFESIYGSEINKHSNDKVSDKH